MNHIISSTVMKCIVKMFLGILTLIVLGGWGHSDPATQNLEEKKSSRVCTIMTLI